jgi:hypothetical protein
MRRNDALPWLVGGLLAPISFGGASRYPLPCTNGPGIERGGTRESSGIWRVSSDPACKADLVDWPHDRDERPDARSHSARDATRGSSTIEGFSGRDLSLVQEMLRPAVPEMGPERLRSRRGQSWRRLLRRGKYLLGHEPVFLPIVLRLTPLGTSRRITDGTDLVVEGFPRSGNTFTTFALDDASEQSLQIASHVHQPSQIKLALSRGLPTVLAIREPVAALSSYLVYDPNFTPSEVIREYCSYHRELVPYAPELLICDFTEITSNMASVVDRINDRFAMSISPFDQSPTNVERIQIKIMNQHRLVYRDRDLDLVRSVASPMTDRDRLSGRMREALLDREIEDELAEAVELYRYFCGVAADQRKAVRPSGSAPADDD